jgi:hypothetical protein
VLVVVVLVVVLVFHATMRRACSACPARPPAEATADGQRRPADALVAVSLGLGAGSVIKRERLMIQAVSAAENFVQNDRVIIQTDT